MGDIGKEVKEYEFEPFPDEVPVETPVVVPEEAPDREEVPA